MASCLVSGFVIGVFLLVWFILSRYVAKAELGRVTERWLRDYSYQRDGY